MDTVKSDGSTASYYELPLGATELQDLISHRNMNAQIGEIFRACYRYGKASHSDRLRDARKMKFYAEAEIARLMNLPNTTPQPPPFTITPAGGMEVHDTPKPYNLKLNVYGKDGEPCCPPPPFGNNAKMPPLPRRTMSFDSPMEEFVAFIKGTN